MLFPKRKIKNKRQKTVFKIAGVFAAVFCFIFIASAGEIFAAAGINKQINYQGRLGDSAGDIVADGNYDIVFKLYTVDTAGTEVWTGTHTAANGNAVAVSKGIFSVLLGSGNGNALNLDFSEDTYYLGVTVGADAEMVPRKRIASVPQAYNSNNLIGDGYIKLTGAPTGTAVDQGTVYVNPASATAGQTLLGLAVGGTQKFKIDEAGNLVASGDLAVDGGDITSVGALTLTPLAGSNLNVSLATTGDFAVNTNQLYVDTSAGFVGIGTATPGMKLDMVDNNAGAGGYRITNNTAGAAAQIQNKLVNDVGGIAYYGVTSSTYTSAPIIANKAFFGSNNIDTVVWTQSANDILFGTGGLQTTNERMRITSTGNVGVGTTNPGVKFEVVGSGVTGLGRFGDGTNHVTLGYDGSNSRITSAGTGQLLINYNNGEGTYVGGGATPGIFGVGEMGSERFIVQASGGVGVGDATPAALFTVGDGDLFQVNSSGAIAAATGITSSGTITFSGLSTAGIVTNTAGGVLGTTAFLPVASGGTGTGTVFTEGSIVFAGADGIYSQNNSNFFWDDVNLRLGIGTVSPGASVDIFGTTNTLRLSYDGTNYGEISSNLNGQLVLQGSGTTEAAAIIGAGLAQDVSVKFDGETEDYYVGVDTDSVFKIGKGMDVGTTPLFLIKPTGGVEIGVSSPSALNARLYSYVSSVDVGSDTPYAGYFYNQANNLTQDGTTKYGVYIMSQGAFTGLTGAATTNYGLYINNTSGADNNYSAYFGTGNIGMGALDPDAKLTIAAVNATSNQLRLRSYRAELVATNVIGGIDFMSNDVDITAPGTVTASIQALASATHNALNLSTDLVFSTMSGLTSSEAMRLNGTSLGVGGVTPGSIIFALASGDNSGTSVADAIVSGSQRIVIKNGDGTLNDKAAFAMEITEAGIGQVRGGMVLTRSGDGVAHPTLSFVTDPANGSPLERMTIDPNGFVGIGTTSPDNKLDIAQTSTTDSQLRLSNNRDALWNFGDTFGGVEFYSADTSTTPGVNAAIKAIHLRAGTDHANADAGLAFYTTNGNSPTNGIATRMVIENVNGNVGIGDITPAALLTVGDGDLFQVNSSGAIAGAKLSLLTNSDSDSEMLRIEAKPVTDLGYSPQNQVVFYSPTITTSTYNAAKIYSTFDGNGYVYGRLTLASPTGVGTWTDVLSVKNGNVGIGTTSPLTRFHTVGATASAATDFIGLFSETGVTPEATTGLTTALAQKAAVVQGDGGAYFVGRDVTNDIEFIFGTSVAGSAFAGSTTNHDFQLRTNNVDRMTIKGTTGNVGIGTANPTYKLQVSSSSTATTPASLANSVLRLSNTDTTNGNYASIEFGSSDTSGTIRSGATISGIFTNHDVSMVQSELGFYTRNISGTVNEAMRIDENGNVGIGDTNPAALFTVGNGSLFQVSSTGAVTTSGGIVSLNANSNFAVNVATGTSTGAVSIGGNANTVAIDSSDWNITATGVMTGISGITNNAAITSVGGQVNLNVSSNYVVNLATGTSTGAITLGGTGTQTISVGNGAGIKTVNLGSATTTSVTTLLSGSGGLNLNVNNSQPTNIATGTSAGAISIGGGSNTVAIDSSSWDISTAGVLSGATGITSSGTITFSDLGTGTVTSTAGVLSVSSDERLKNIQGVFVRGITEIMAIDPILYKWNELSGLETESTYAGFSAQNIQAAIPEAVAVDPRGFLTLSDRPIIAALVNSVKEQQTMITGNAVQLEDLDLKTIQGITTLSDLQSSVDAQLGLIGESLNEINGEMDDNQDILAGYGNRIESQEKLTAVLQAQVEKLQSLTQSEADLAYADLFSAILSVDEEGNVDIFGIKNFTVENIATGNLIATGDIIGNLIGNVDSEVVETDRIVVDAEKKDKPTIGTGVIPADADQVSIETGAVTDDSKIYITPIGTTDNQVVYVGNIEKEKGFEVKVDRIDKIEKKDINFNWWIVGSKKDNQGN